MSMAVKLSSKKGSGWLVMRDNHPNKFVNEKNGITAHDVCIEYGTVVKWDVHLSQHQWERTLDACGIIHRYGVVKD